MLCYNLHYMTKTSNKAKHHRFTAAGALDAVRKASAIKTIYADTLDMMSLSDEAGRHVATLMVAGN